MRTEKRRARCALVRAGDSAEKLRVKTARARRFLGHALFDRRSGVGAVVQRKLLLDLVDALGEALAPSVQGQNPVSYTHLTLPTT